jgi:dephospho-CoA kinase
VLRETLDIWGIPHGRDNEQRLAIIMNAESGFHDGALPRAMKKRLTDSTDDVAILDGARWLPDETMLRELPAAGVKSIIIYIDASIERRYERLKKRDRANEGRTSREKFARQNKMQNELDIPTIGARADVKIENDTDDIQVLKNKIETAYKEKIRPLL